MFMLILVAAILWGTAASVGICALVEPIVTKKAPPGWYVWSTGAPVTLAFYLQHA